MSAGGTWHAPVDITESKVGDEPQIAFDKLGNALALWQGYDGGGINEWVLESAFKPAGGGWQAPVTVSAPGLAGEPHLAFNEQGSAAAVWDQWTSGFLSTRTVQATLMPAGGAWQAPVDIIGEADELDQPKEAGEPGIAVDGQGDAVAVWAWTFGNPVIQAAFKTTGGAWQTPVKISASGEGMSSPQVAFDGQGNALAVWDGGHGVVQAASKPVGRAWQAPVYIGLGGGPHVAFDGQGDALAVWNGEHGIQGAGYAAAGPLLNGVSMPTTGVVGQSLTFSVAPLDVWSVLTATSWSFGDSATTSGTSVTHTYSAAGSYEVTLHSADVFGNATSTSGTVTIAPATSTPPVSAPASAPTTEPPPTISAVSQSAPIWRESGKAPVGTNFSLSLNERATVHFRFARRVNGRMVGHKCLTESPTNIKHQTCSRTITAGLLSFTGHRGANKTEFQGRVSRSTKLNPGHYTLVIAATNTVGERSLPKSLSFTIMK